MLWMCVAACTNNGDIGPLYGLWAMDGCTADGKDVTDIDCRDFYWRFQGRVVAINRNIGAHEHLEWVGTFVHSGAALEVDFSEGEVDTAFDPEQWGLSPGPMTMQVPALDGSRMILRYVARNGVTWQYSLRKIK